MRKSSALLMAGLLMVAVVGCSTKSNEDISTGADDTVSQTEGGDRSTTTTDRSSAGDDDAGSDSGSSGSLGDMVETCGAVSAMTVTLGLGSAFLSDEQKAQVEEQLDGLEGKVPDEIKDDIETISNGADVDSLTELGEFLDSPEYEQATENIRTWIEANCNIDDPFG